MGKRPRILVVEDHRDTANVLRRLLATSGIEADAAYTARDALAAWEQAGPFDLLVCDIGLPDRMGTDLLRDLTVRCGQLVPAIALTGLTLPEDVADIRAAGFADFLAKPVSFQVLEESVRRVLERGGMGADVPRATHDRPRA